MGNKLKSSFENKKVGFTSVVGDLLHAGHVVMLDECKMYCDYLYVGIIIDPKKDRPFKNKPIQSSFERYCQVIPLDGEDDLLLALKTLPINMRFVGEDYKGKDFTGKKECIDLGIDIIYNKRKHGLSSNELRERIEANA